MTTWYAATNGNGAAAGDAANPVDLQTACSSIGGKIKPGDTVFMRGGTYSSPISDGFNPEIPGAAKGNEVFFRNYPGEHVKIDAKAKAFGLYMKGSGIIFWPSPGGCGKGIEITDSTTNRVIPSSGQVPNANGIGTYAPGIKIINCHIHDTAQGISSYSASPDCEFYGNICHGNGNFSSISGDRNHGHGMYVQNSTGTKVLQHNFIGDNFCEGIQAYGSGAAYVIGMTIDGNCLYCTDSPGNGQFQYNLVIGNGTNRDNLVSNNTSFFPLLPNNEGFYLVGQYGASSNFVHTGNDIVGGYASFGVEGMGSPFINKNNRVVNVPSAPTGLVRFGQFSDQNTSGFSWDQNQYFGCNMFYKGQYTVDANFNYALVGGTEQPFSAWQTETGFDKNSSFAAAIPTGQWVRIDPNRYETKRANVRIVNWDCLDANGNVVAGKAPSAVVDLSSVLSEGDPFVVLDAQNFVGPPVVSGTYSGPVTIPLENLPKMPGTGYTAPKHWGPFLGTFIVMSSAGQDVVNPTPAPQPPSPVTPASGGTTTGGSPVAVGAGYIQNELLVVKTNLTDKARAIPDASATTQVTGTATSGEVCKVIGTTEVVGPDGSGGSLNFVQVTFESGVSGWVPDAYLTPAPAGTVFTPTSGGGTTPPPPTPKANLSWGASPTAGVTYSVGRATQSGGPYTTLASGLTQTTYTDPSVAPGGSYWYVVWATNANGDSSNTNEWEAVVSASAPGSGTTTPPPAKPEPPTNLTGTVTWS